MTIDSKSWRATHAVLTSMRRTLIVGGQIAALVVFGLTSAACERPVVIGIQVGGEERLPLRGDVRVEGRLRRAISYEGVVYPKDTPVAVNETVLIRKDGGDPPAYRITGLYDPAVRTDGLILPASSLNVVLMAAVLPDRTVIMPLPQIYFVKAGEN